ncbi:MAG: tRNA uridine-5-carboxymethylaminomethyl(34) synthesis GTPase MnmE [Prevotella sp.]|nr:tRNA uridine-5-carboxymethylaminomethyl(34) synthesis GTPase MnmE [Prevotella sp.]
MNNDTICAPATAAGGALGIIRVSGPEAFFVVSSLCAIRCDSVAANTIHYTRIADGTDVVDEVMVSIFRAPRSYTGEDSVEISCHGSSYIVNKLLDLLVQRGCRMARPGEFTQRAYLNGKLDLSQAEAVADLIASSNRATHRLAMSQLRGGISTELSKLREQLLKLTSLLELELDFSDHEDLEFADRTELLALAQTIEAHIARLARTFETGQALKQGIPVAIVGKTNVGKSTLLNRLLGDDRAIVSDIHGTTRDTIEDIIDIQGVTFRFIDTAGIRQTTDQVEQIGINRTYQAIAKARIVLWLLDEEPTAEEQKDMANLCEEKKLIVVCNKADQGVVVLDSSLFILHSSFLAISAKTGQGIDALQSAIYAAASLQEFSDSDVIVTSARHYDALQRAHASILRVIEGMGGHDSSLFILHSSLPPDLLAEDLRQTLEILAEITGGQITPQETLNNIFSHFCVGK